MGEPQRRGRRPPEGLRAPRALRELRGPGDALSRPSPVRPPVPPGGRAHPVRVGHLHELPEGVRGPGMRSEKDLIAEALGDLQKEETIERALGRILRRYGQTYAEYLRIMDIARAAPASVPDVSASARAASCTISPRAQFTRYAVRFISASSFAPIIPFVSGVRAAWMLR